MEKTEAGLKGLYIRELRNNTKNQLQYVTTTSQVETLCRK